MSSDSYTYLIKIDSNGNAVLPALNKNAKQSDTSLRKIGTSSKKSFASLNQGVNRSNAVLSKTKSLLAGIGLTLSAGAIATGLVKTGAGFEQKMSTVAALTQASKTEFVSLEKSARQAGATTSFSAQQSAEAMGFLAMAGYKTNQIIEALPATLNLAAASSLELGRSADIATNILSQYQLKAKDTGTVVDQLAFTQANFNTNMEELANAMNYFGPNAAAMNISLSESNAVIGLLANNGLKGSLATRALGSSLVRLTKPTSQMQSLMDELNLSFFDAEGRFVGMAGMVETLNKGLAGMTDQQKQATISTLFGAEAIQEINILLSEGSGRIQEWTEKLNNAEGSAKRMADTKLDNLAGDFQILKSTTQEFSLKIYEALGPTLRALTKEATLFVRNMDPTQLSKNMQKFVLGLRKSLIWIRQNKELLVGIGKAYISIKAGMLAYNALIRVATLKTGTYNTTLVITNSSAAGATLAVRGLNTALKAHPYGMLLGAITAVVSAITLFKNRTKEATAAQQELNLEQVEARFLKQETQSLLPQTEKDKEKLELGQLDERQLRFIKQEAQLRKEKAEDALLEMKSQEKSVSDEYQEHKEFIDRQDRQRPGGPKALFFKENSRLMEFDDYIDSLPEIITGLSSGQLNKVVSENKSIINKIDPSLKDDDENDPLLKDDDKIDPLIKDETVTGLEGAADEMSERIVGGGSSQRIVNVSLGKFFEDMVFNVNGSEGVVQQADDIRERFLEMYMRVLNSANQMANG